MEWNIIMVEFCTVHKIKTVVVFLCSDMEKPQRYIIKGQKKQKQGQNTVFITVFTLYLGDL